MANKWVPPIPTEKLYSPPAMKLGAGLALLVWCYDGVERDGTVKIELGKANAALGVSYRTIKEWWRLINEGPFFSNVKDRGKLGYVATFNRDWIEWRVMETNYPTEQISEGQKTALEDITSKPVQGLADVLEGSSKPVQSPVKAASRTDEGQIAAPDLYIGTPDDQRSKHVAAIAATAPSETKTRKPKPTQPEEPPTPIEIRQALADVCDVDISPGAKPPAKMLLLLNGEAKAIWQQVQSQGKSIKAAVAGIQETARYTRATDKRFQNGGRIPTQLIRENWTAAGRWIKEQSGGYANGSPNGMYHTPIEYDDRPLATLEEIEAEIGSHIKPRRAVTP